MSQQDVDPHTFVILGGTGDLTQRKLLPSLYRVSSGYEISDRFQVLGVAPNDELDDESYRALILEEMRAHTDLFEDAGDGAVREWVQSTVRYQSIGKGHPSEYDRLRSRLRALEETANRPENRVFYLALPPQVFETAITGLSEAGLNDADGWTRLVVEKPFGHDLASAEALNRHAHEHFNEDQIYRIDHYLGKETVQNLLIFRFANPIFEDQWNRDRIDQITVTVAEGLGVGDRAGYYDRAGAVRDMLQNHVTQLFSLIAMEEPARFEPNAVRDEKVKVLESVRSIDVEDDVVLGQYACGTVDEESVPAYTDEPEVPHDSQTETFAAVRLEVENWRWQGVPFYLRTGKRLPAKSTRIEIQFERAPVCFFKSFGECQIQSNKLVITLQPDEGFSLYFEVKKPGEPLQVDSYPLDFQYSEAFEPLPDAYSTLLLDVMQGDQTLFVRSDEVEAAWTLYQPILDAALPVHEYEAGSRGPKAARRLMR